MPYPDQLLADDEQVVRHLHPHWITLVRPVFFFVLLVGGGSFLAAIVPDRSWRGIAWIAVGVVCGILLIGLSVIPFLRWRTTHYVLTTHRVLIRTGILHHHGRDIAFSRINDVSFELTLWERIIGAGTLMVESAGESGQQVLRNVPHSDRVQQAINRLIEQDHDRRTRESARYEAQYEVEYERGGRTERPDDR